MVNCYSCANTRAEAGMIVCTITNKIVDYDKEHKCKYYKEMK